MRMESSGEALSGLSSEVGQRDVGEVEDRLGLKLPMNTQEKTEREKKEEEEEETEVFWWLWWKRGEKRRRRRTKRDAMLHNSNSSSNRDSRNSRRRQTETIHSTVDMSISRSCRCRLRASMVLWTTVCLLLLARGVSSVSDDQTRFTRSLKYEQDGEAQGGVNMQETLNVMQFLRELIQRQQQLQQQQQQQMRANQNSIQMYGSSRGEEGGEREIDWRKVPLLYQIRSLINDGSKEEDKRGSYMSLCHFKICNLG